MTIKYCPIHKVQCNGWTHRDCFDYIAEHEATKKPDSALIRSLQLQVEDLRKHAREYARKDLMAELRDGVERIHIVLTTPEIQYVAKKDILALIANFESK